MLFLQIYNSTLLTLLKSKQTNRLDTMTFRFSATIDIHPSAMGHIIGKRGYIIKRIRKECGVVTFNPPYTENQRNMVKMTIEGKSRNAVQQAIFQMDHQIAISNRWCRNNGVEYY